VMAMSVPHARPQALATNLTSQLRRRIRAAGTPAGHAVTAALSLVATLADAAATRLGPGATDSSAGGPHGPTCAAPQQQQQQQQEGNLVAAMPAGETLSLLGDALAALDDVAEARADAAAGEGGGERLSAAQREQLAAMRTEVRRRETCPLCRDP
jgi:hypothetical protein